MAKVTSLAGAALAACGSSPSTITNTVITVKICQAYFVFMCHPLYEISFTGPNCPAEEEGQNISNFSRPIFR
jgi:hypothetical protein